MAYELVSKVVTHGTRHKMTEVRLAEVKPLMANRLDLCQCPRALQGLSSNGPDSKEIVTSFSGRMYSHWRVLGGVGL